MSVMRGCPSAVEEETVMRRYGTEYIQSGQEGGEGRSGGDSKGEGVIAGAIPVNSLCKA